MAMGRKFEVMRLNLLDLFRLSAWVELDVHSEHWLHALVRLVHIILTDGGFIFVKLLNSIDKLSHCVDVNSTQSLKSQEIYEVSKSEESRAFFSQVASVAVSHMVGESQCFEH